MTLRQMRTLVDDRNGNGLNYDHNNSLEHSEDVRHERYDHRLNIRVQNWKICTHLRCHGIEHQPRK